MAISAHDSISCIFKLTLDVFKGIAVVYNICISTRQHLIAASGIDRVVLCSPIYSGLQLTVYQSRYFSAVQVQSN